MAGRTVRAIAGVAIVVLLSKFLGLGREMVIAHRFGTSTEYDLYLVAVMLPALAYGIINFATFYLLVPYLTRLFESNTREAALPWRTAWALYNKMMLVALAVAAGIAFLAPVVMPLWSSSFTGPEFARLIFYTRCTAVMALLGSSEAFLRALLNVRGSFTYPSASYIVENGVNIAVVVLLTPFFSIGAVVIALIAGLAAQNIYLLFRVFTLGGFRHYGLSLRDGALAGLLPTAGMLLLIELLNRSYFLVDRYVAAGFGAGVISALNYSQVLVQLPDAVVGFAIASVIFPRFSSIEHENDPAQFGKLYRHAITGGLLVAIPIAFFFYFGARDLVQLIFLGGRFDPRSLELTVNVLQPYCPTIAALFIISTSIRACYGRGWGRSVFLITAVAFALKLLGTILLPRYFLYAGISLATTTSMLTLAAGLLILCLRRSRSDRNPEFRQTVLRLAMVGVLLSAGLLAATRYIPMLQSANGLSPVLRLLVLGLVLVGFYALLIVMFGFGTYLKRIRGVPANGG